MPERLAHGGEAEKLEGGRYGMVIDLDRCIGCRACEVACKVENNTAKGIFWMHVFRFEIEEYPNTRIAFLPRPCQHCDNPPCVKVCPVGARFKQENGLVLTDFDRCIGCRLCQVACRTATRGCSRPATSSRSGGIRGRDQSGAHRVGDGLRAVPQVKLVEDVLHVEVDGVP